MFWRTVKHGMHCWATHFLCTKRMIEGRTIGVHICHILCWENECRYDFINIVNDSKTEYLPVLFRINRKTILSMWKQHAIADFNTSQLFLCCMLAWETLLQRKRRTGRFTNVELLLILRAYRAYLTRWIDVLNHVKANTSRTTPSALRDRNITSAESRMSVKPGKLMSAGIIGDEEIR